MSKKADITVTMTRRQALELDILRCTCGHRPNNHFDFSTKSCAHCRCKAYDERISLPRVTEEDDG